MSSSMLFETRCVAEMSPKLLRVFLICLVLSFGGCVLCVGHVLNTMPVKYDFDDVTAENPPFLSDDNTINYVKTSKFMVLLPFEDGKMLQRISDVYGSSASCLAEDHESKLIEEATKACLANQNVIAIKVKNSQSVKNLAPFVQMAFTHNYVVSVIKEEKTMLPQYVGWHLNEADSCMLNLCAQALLEDLLKTIPEFCSDFRNFTQMETISDMLKYYELASSNHNGMLHCTAKYFGSNPPPSSQMYFNSVESSLTENFETTVIGLVFTPRTFGARVKLSSQQLVLWGGDDSKIGVHSSVAFDGSEVNKEKDLDSIVNLESAMSGHSLESHSDKQFGNSIMACSKTLTPEERKPTHYFPNCRASLKYPTLNLTDVPDFHPIPGPGHKAHMTIGVAPGVSAVTTGYDLLEIVNLEGQGTEWKTYTTPRGWLRDYGEGRWVLYMKNNITVDSLFAGVYQFS